MPFSKLRLLFLLLVLTVSCSNDGFEDIEVQGSKQTNGNDTITLKFWGGVPIDAGPQTVIDKWNDANPEVQVEYVHYANDERGNLMLDTALYSGKEVDLYTTYILPQLKQRVNAGVALNLNHFEDYNNEEKMGPAVLDWKIDDSYYALPTKKNYFLILLNKDLLDEVGLPVPQDWTMETLREYALKLKGPNRWGLLQFESVLPYPLDGAMEAEGYVNEDGTSNLDHPYVHEYFTHLYEMMYVDKTMPPLGEQLANKMPVDMMFLNEEAAMLFGGEWVLRYLQNKEISESRFTVAFAPIPKLSAEQEDYQNIGGLGDAISIHPNSPYQKEAWEFLKWYADEGMYPMAAGGRLPASKDADMEKAMALLLEGNEGRYHEESLISLLNGEHTTIQLPLDQELREFIKKEYEDFFLNNQTLEEFVRSIVDFHNWYLMDEDERKMCC